MKKQTNNLKAGSAKKRYYILGAVISALVVGHFVTQLFLIANENWNAEESRGRVDSPRIEFAIPQPPETAAVPETSEVRKGADLVADQKIQPHTPVRVSQARIKDNPQSKARSERLRRVEKLLTGF